MMVVPVVMMVVPAVVVVGRAGGGDLGARKLPRGVRLLRMLRVAGLGRRLVVRVGVVPARVVLVVHARVVSLPGGRRAGVPVHRPGTDDRKEAAAEGPAGRGGGAVPAPGSRGRARFLRRPGPNTGCGE